MKPVLATTPLMMPVKKALRDLTQEQKDFAFKMVCNPEDWKDAIDVQLNIEAATDLLQRNGIEATTADDLMIVMDDVIPYFTATPARCFREDDGKTMTVQAEGYRMGPAGDY